MAFILNSSFLDSLHPMNLKQDNTLAMKIQRQTYILITQIFNRVPALIFEGNIGKELTNVTKMFTFK